MITCQFASVDDLKASYGDFFDGGVLTLNVDDSECPQPQLGQLLSIRITLPDKQCLNARVEVIGLPQPAQQWPWLMLRFAEQTEQIEQYIEAFLSHHSELNLNQGGLLQR